MAIISYVFRTGFERLSPPFLNFSITIYVYAMMARVISLISGTAVPAQLESLFFFH